jgi:hypothetical protein
MGREGKAIVGNPFATGHLQGTVSLVNERENKEITNVSTSCHLIKRALRKISTAII